MFSKEDEDVLEILPPNVCDQTFMQNRKKKN
jgi:hypothetical protein